MVHLGNGLSVVLRISGAWRQRSVKSMLGGGGGGGWRGGGGVGWGCGGNLRVILVRVCEPVFFKPTPIIYLVFEKMTY